MVQAIRLAVKARKGDKTFIVAVVRKMLVFVHHLLVNGEEYVEERFKKKMKTLYNTLRFGKIIYNIKEQKDIISTILA
jgi:hypothetical protein